jgi:parallel beta-helix repeat protein
MAADRQAWIYRGLTAVGILLLVAIYFAPIWWVSLTAPNYPAEAFPDGVRIHFHANGVFNGCEKVAKTEITEVEALDCVHEMDTINHYVGMYPIAAGGVIERAFSPYLFSLLGIMLVGFMVGDPKRRTLVMGIGFAALAAWMYLGWYTADGLKYQNAGYVEALVTALDQDTSSDPEVVSSGNAIVDRLRASLEASGVKVDDGKPDQSLSGKARNLQHLRVTFDKDQERRPGDERLQWDGSGSQMMSWHYEKSLARYFTARRRHDCRRSHRVLGLAGGDAVPAGRDAAQRQHAVLVAGGALGAVACFFHHRLFGLALVVWAHPERHGRIYRQTFHANRVRRRQGRPVHHAFLSAYRLRADGAAFGDPNLRRQPAFPSAHRELKMTALRVVLVVFCITAGIGSTGIARASQTLQQMIDATDENGLLSPPPGTYQGPILIDKPITLDGAGKVTVDAGGKGSVIVIKTDGVTLSGLRLINSGESHNDIDAGVQVRGNFNVIRDNVIENSLFGVDLQQSNNNVVRRNRISSKDFKLGQRGDAIRLWYSFNNKITDNDVRDARDTVVWYSADNEIARNGR